MRSCSKVRRLPDLLPFPLALLIAVAALGAACESRRAPATLAIRLVTPSEHPEQATLTVVGVPSHYLPSRREVLPEQWPSIFRVTVVPDADAQGAVLGSDLPAVAGAYDVTGDAIVFTPLFGFDPGRRYRAVFDGSRLPASRDAWRPDPVVAVITLPKKSITPTTVVDHIYPTSDVIPENQLRFYIHFSAPMGRKGGLEYVRLLDARGREVKGPFLPLDAELWNEDRTRFTMFFDPGRVKRGILPNEQMGRPLKAGGQYTLVVDRDWRDGQGAPLKDTFQRTFRAGPADMRPLDPASWRLKEPVAGSRDALVVTFPEPLDHGLLMRALGVTDSNGRPISGETAVAAQETQWAFTPHDPWAAADYRLVALTILEDLAGNRIGRAFEVDEFQRVDPQAEQERIALPFRIQ